ncbi:MAG TPA: hypothetical protein VGR95_07345 [Thermoanaerobaculia bacterium]|nr:hypothetical protein [Thermoanaerobaculia bacterium]
MTTLPDPTEGASPNIRRLTCSELIAQQNRQLAGECAHKKNRLSCRCSGCESDGRYPVITGPLDAPLLNTGYDISTGGALSSGSDAQWEVGKGTTAGPSSVSTWIKAYIVVNPTLLPSPPGAWTNSPFGNAAWISLYNNGQQDPGNLDIYYRYRFNLASSVNPATFAVTMRFFADNQVADIWVNGVSQRGLPNGSSILPQIGYPPTSGDDYGASGFGPRSAVTITLDNSWQRCENEIVVQVHTSIGYTGFLAQNDVDVKVDLDGCDCHCDCKPVAFPEITPCIEVKWGDSDCDCLETDDVEVLCITICNCYSNVTFEDLSIAQILVLDGSGRPVPNLPDGTPSVQVIPSGPICFDDIGPCVDGRPTCVSRELVLYTRGAVGGRYRLVFRGLCFKVCHEYEADRCFVMELCRD